MGSGKSSDKTFNQLTVVGVGASAGGLEALRAFFGAFKAIPPTMTFVVVQHLSPRHRSMLVELIGHSTTLTVKELLNHASLQPGVVYITPPNKDAILENDKIRLKSPHFKIGPKPSIDIFLKSLAENSAKKSIAVILSGTGSDGSLGVRAIKAAGGVVFCQTPSSAKYDGMPKAAALTGAVDFDLAPELMPERLIEISQNINGSRKQAVSKTDSTYFEILAKLKTAVGVDFEKYKQATVRRRIDRRMIATKTKSHAEYSKYVDKNTSELHLLYQDLLISVTSFFRDPLFFKDLAKYIADAVKIKKTPNPFRVWTIGCATGEEAFSIAILIKEALRNFKKDMHFQIFASDIDENALKIARRSVYTSASLTDVPKELLGRYFERDADTFRVKQELRERVIFSKHNILADPPFLNMDLISCRNILIYFDSTLQSRVFQTIHYSLGLGGILFLGKSENVPSYPKFFKTTNRSSKVYLRNELRGELPRASIKAEKLRDTALTGEKSQTLNDGRYSTLEEIITSFAPNSIAIGGDMQILHVFGDAGKFLTIPKGQGTPFLNRMIPNEASFELPILIQRCLKYGEVAVGLKRIIKHKGRLLELQLRLSKLPSQDGSRFLVSMESSKAPLESKASRVRGKLEDSLKLKEDLLNTRNALQSIIEEQEASGEELQSLNEEMQSANEELQSSNEELETANEELQSSNEELTTLNEEINVKSAELSALNFRLQAIQNAIVYPLIVVDIKLKLLSFNPAGKYLLRLGDHDHGQFLISVSHHLDLRGPVEKLQHCIRKGTEAKIQFNSHERSFEIQIHLVRGPKNEVDGAVMSFVENTEIVTALNQNRVARTRLTDILDNTPAMVSMKDPSGVYVYANRRFAEILGTSAEDIPGKTTEEIFGASTGDQIRELDFEVIKKRQAVQADELIRLKDKTLWLASSKFPLLDPQNKVQSVCTISLDVTKRVSHEQQLELFKRAVARAGTGIAIFEWNSKELLTSYVSENLTKIYNMAPTSGVNFESFLRELLANARSEIVDVVLHSVKANKPVNERFSFPSRHDEVWVELKTFPLTFGKETSYIVLSIGDITQSNKDQKLIATQQDELSKFNRYSAIGEISAGIAHEINTPLNVISTKTDILKVMTKTGKISEEKILKVSEDISQMVKNISGIVLGLKSLTGETSDKFEKVDVSVLIRDTLKICEFRIQRSGLTLKIRIPDKAVFVKVIPVQISQILINLINNSVDALQDKKDQWLEVEAAEKRDGVYISVTDSGFGIDSALAEKIMTPFFTTKKDSKGTGIGLSLSRSIARRHGGNLSLDHNHTNTSFVLTLPRFSEAEVIDLNEEATSG